MTLMMKCIIMSLILFLKFSNFLSLDYTSSYLSPKLIIQVKLLTTQAFQKIFALIATKKKLHLTPSYMPLRQQQLLTTMLLFSSIVLYVYSLNSIICSFAGYTSIDAGFITNKTGYILHSHCRSK